jgi:DNA-binding HxlR family transcriptional regulator
VLGRDYEGQNCSAARALEVIGERWSLLIVRDVGFGGIRRFNDLQRNLGVARNVLASRLDHLVAEGVLDRLDAGDTPYPTYMLTAKGKGLLDVIAAMTQWGDNWYAPAGPPVTFHHDDCAGEVRHQLVCTQCGRAVESSAIKVCPGPGFGRETDPGAARAAPPVKNNPSPARPRGR